VIGPQRIFLLVIAMLMPSVAYSQAAPMDETADQKVIIDAVKVAVDRHDYRALDKMENEFRRTRSRTISGVWKLSLLHWRVLTELGPKEGQCGDRSADFFRGWFADSPTQPAPYIDRAAVLEDDAWCIRGVGFANSVSGQAFEGFGAKVAEARKMLVSHRGVASTDPHYFAVMERISIDQGAEKADFKHLLDEGTAREPDYHSLYFDAYRYYQPQWYGSDGEIDGLARYAAKQTTSSEGLGMYARFYWHALACDCAIPSVDWPTMKAGMRDVMARYPSDWNAANFARISCKMQDPKEAASWFARVKKDYTAAWTDKVEMRRCESMAQFQTSAIHTADRCPYAAIEMWPNADFEKICRHPN
jgi:hypothetical protein